MSSFIATGVAAHSSSVPRALEGLHSAAGRRQAVRQGHAQRCMVAGPRAGKGKEGVNIEHKQLSKPDAAAPAAQPNGVAQADGERACDAGQVAVGMHGQPC